jgi:HSP20 family protein
MTLISCNPNRSALQREAGMLQFSDLFGNLMSSHQWPEFQNQFRPLTNVIETSVDFQLELTIPGFSKNDVSIQLEDGLLKITGERKTEQKKDTVFHRKDFSLDKFSRSYELPENVDAENIKASYDLGVLTLLIPKKPEAVKRPPVEISIN